MLQITIAADYAVRAVLYLASQGHNCPVPSMEIARQQEIPRQFIPKILQALARAGILKTCPGRSGGATLTLSPHKISMFQIIEAVDGPVALNKCLSTKTKCSRDSVCPAHPAWVKIQDSFSKTLKKIKISDINKNN